MPRNFEQPNNTEAAMVNMETREDFFRRKNISIAECATKFREGLLTSDMIEIKASDLGLQRYRLQFEILEECGLSDKFLSYFEQAVTEKDFDNREEIIDVFFKQKEAGDVVESETKHPVRAAAWHTINKLDSYADINAPTKEESDQKFLELTRNLWNELTIHGTVRKDAETGKWEMLSGSDLDGESCLKLLEIAGIQIDRSKINFVENGNSAESGLVLDTSNNHGVIAEESGKRLIFDHHAEESDRNTSAAKFLYETLVGMGLLEKKPYLDKYVEFVTRDDNKDFSEKEYKKIFKNYYCNLYGINRKLSIKQILELFEKGQDPMEPIPDDYLESHTYFNPATKKEETLAELGKNMLKKVVAMKKEIGRMEKQGFSVDSGKANYGKILIDMKMLKLDGKYQPHIFGDAGGPIAAFARGYDTYVCWSPKENSFAVFTKKEMSRDFLSQGRNTRGYMWTKNGRDMQPLAVTLEEILSKLSGKPFVIEGGLKNAIEDAERKNLEQEEINAQEKEKQEKISQSAKRMGEWFSDLELSYENIREEAKKANFSIAELAMKFIQENVGLKAEYESRKSTIDEKDDKAVEKLALSVILESEKKKLEEKIKIGGENDVLRMKLVDVGADLLEVKLGVFSNQSPVTPNIPPQSPSNTPPSPEKLSADQLREAAGQIKTQFNIDVQTDQIAGEDNNWEIMNKFQGALSKIDKEKLSNIKTIGLHQSVSRVLSGEGAVALAYTLSPEEMAVKINELLGEMDRKKAEIFESNQFVKEVRAKSPELLNNLKRQMDEQKVPIKAQLNFLEIVAGADLDDDEVENLKNVHLMVTFTESTLARKVVFIGAYTGGKMEVRFGSDAKFDKKRMSIVLKRVADGL